MPATSRSVLGLLDGRANEAWLPVAAGAADMKKNSLVNNINRRKAAGTSRSKAKSTISDAAYAAMKSGWKKKKA